jgi:hypothetical protein
VPRRIADAALDRAILNLASFQMNLTMNRTLKTLTSEPVRASAPPSGEGHQEPSEKANLSFGQNSLEIPIALHSMIVEIEAFESRILEITPEENTHLLALCHKLANALQDEILLNELRPHYVHPIRPLHHRYSEISEVLNSIRSRASFHKTNLPM